MNDPWRAIRKLNEESYSSGWEQYVEATRDYSAFPGLEDEIALFLSRVRECGELVLDLGSGGGRDSRYICANGFQVCSVDISLEMLRCCVPDQSWRVGADLLQLPFRDATFDGVWACASLLHVPLSLIESAFQELLRVLRPGAPFEVSLLAGSGEETRTGGNVQGSRFFSHVDPDPAANMMRQCGASGVSVTQPGRGAFYSITGFG